MTDNTRAHMDTKCLLCLEEMEPSFPGAIYEPEGGGQVVFVFRFGSKKFDNAPGQTQFHGVVCDACAERLVERMECRKFTSGGKLVYEEGEKRIGKIKAFWKEIAFSKAIKAPGEPPTSAQDQKKEASTTKTAED
jgi:hypothetical protein